MGQALAKCGKLDSIFENVLATGNLPAMADLGMQQDSGIVLYYYNTVFGLKLIRFFNNRSQYHGGKY